METKFRQLKYFSLVAFLCFIGGHLAAQAPDKVRGQYDSLSKSTLTRYDFTSQRLNNKVDSLQLRVNNILNPNLSIDPVFQRLRQRRATTKDTLEAKQQLDSIKGGIQHAIDSLKGLSLPTDKYVHKLDSISRISPAAYLAQVQSKVGDVQTKVNQPVNGIEGKVNDKLALMNQQGGAAANLPGSAAIADLKLPGTETMTDLNLNGDVPGLEDINNPFKDVNNPMAGEMDQLERLKDKIDGAKSVPQQQADRLKSIDEVEALQGKAGQANGVIDKAQAYQKDATNLVQGNIGELEAIPEAIEQRVASLDEMQELQKQTGEIAKYQDILASGNDPEALKSMAKQQAIKYAKDHFAGQEAVLMAAMDKLNKVKSKYPAVSSLKDLPRRVPNQMKGKPLIERIVPGFHFQIQKSGTLLLDLSPTVGYRFAGRFTAGVGWNERLSFKEWNQIVADDRIFGPRAFVVFNLKKGFSLKAEGEYMSVCLPTFVSATERHRDWVWSVFAGIQKDYTFYRNIRGNVQMLYNLYDDRGNSPYVDRFNVRMGWEFPMKKRSRDSKGN
jgi:hypothetical protein